MLDKNIDLNGKVILVTGSAGFIGANLVQVLLKELKGATIIGLDNLNDYYDVSLKEFRLRCCEGAAEESVRGSNEGESNKEGIDSRVGDGKAGEGNRYKFIKGDLADKGLIDRIFAECQPDIVVNLAAQAGVRWSIDHPDAYIQSNIIGFYNILEACRHSYDNSAKGVEHLVYASSSSVYGSNKKIPYATEDKVDNPVSLYAATKKSNELLAHAYSKLYHIPSTGLRFFTVYGPAGRPDMAYFGFTDKLRAGKKIQIFNYGNCLRDFTYIDDIVEGIKRVMQHKPSPSLIMEGDHARLTKEGGTVEDGGKFYAGEGFVPYAIYNIGNSHPENLLEFVDILQQELIRAKVLPEDYDFETHKELVPMQPGDVPVTYADTTPLERDFGFKPNTPLRRGLRRFAEWYAEFYKVNSTNET